MNVLKNDELKNLLKRFQNPYWSFFINLAYAVGNSVIGFVSGSWWFVTMGAYYSVLSAARFCVLHSARQAKDNPDMERFAQRVTGGLLVGLSVCLTGINVLSTVEERGSNFHEIVMITIAAYSFTKITLAIIGMVKAKGSASLITKTVRNITFADAVVAIYSLQRSMLVSFPGLQPSEIRLFNILTGTGVTLIVLLLGINLLGGSRVDMAKSKIAKGVGKIADVVTTGYKVIENGVTEGYKKVEQAVVGSYTKIEDKFVDAYLTREGETVEEAKARLRKENPS